MLHRVILTAASVIALATAANAADMGSYKSGPASYASVNWSGLYGGVNGGYGDGTSKLGIEDQTTTTTPGSTIQAGGQVIINGVVQPTNSITSPGATTTSNSALSKSLDTTGGFAGGQIGYNVQNGRVVFGVEADIEASGITGSTTATSTITTAKGKSTLDDFGTLRARVGYTFDPVLVYVTGGLAFGDTTDSLTMTNGGVTTSKSKSGSQTGYVLGAGAEYSLNPAWSVKAEYQYIDLGSTTLALGAAPNDAKFTADHNYNTVRVGVNYHVGAGFDPLK